MLSTDACRMLSGVGHRYYRRLPNNMYYLYLLEVATTICDMVGIPCPWAPLLSLLGHNIGWVCLVGNKPA